MLSRGSVGKSTNSTLQWRATASPSPPMVILVILVKKFAISPNPRSSGAALGLRGFVSAFQQRTCPRLPPPCATCTVQMVILVKKSTRHPAPFVAPRSRGTTTLETALPPSGPKTQLRTPPSGLRTLRLPHRTILHPFSGKFPFAHPFPCYVTDSQIPPG